MPLSRAIIPSPELEEERGKELAAAGGGVGGTTGCSLGERAGALLWP